MKCKPCTRIVGKWSEKDRRGGVVLQKQKKKTGREEETAAGQRNVSGKEGRKVESRGVKGG